MQFLYQALLSSCITAGVLVVARLLGSRAAGLVTGLPIVTAPTLVWIALVDGAPLAAGTAIGSVGACVTTAAFALGYERLARCRGPLVSFLGALTAAASTVVPAKIIVAAGLGTSLIVALATVLGVLWLLPVARCEIARRRLPCELLLCAAVTGLVSATAAWLAASVGGFAAGLLASLPIIASIVVWIEHHANGWYAVSRFMRAYAAGLLGKAAFGAVFAQTVIEWGPAIALPGALAAAVTTLLAAHRGTWTGAARLLRRLGRAAIEFGSVQSTPRR